MKGYIGVTDPKWWSYIKNSNLTEVNYWCKKKSFQVIEEGDFFFFLKRKSQGEKGERHVVGCAKFVRFECLKPIDAWKKYGEGNGHPTQTLFLENMENTLHSEDDDKQIGCIILSNPIAFDKPVLLSNLDIEFANCIVSGKSISVEECEKILRASV